MANNVFANGRELACKSGSGKSIAAFPDVCMTPPENPATPPGVPVPYPNTGMASDTTSGSRTVSISGKEVMLKNKSYFKKSSGDEAGAAAKKGVVSSVNRGKVYFAAWSMNVKFEGENVVRHLDMTTHNHGSPTNGPMQSFADESSRAPAQPDECRKWELQPSRQKYTADEKKDRLRRTGDQGDAFEAKAADHNKIKDGDDMSGPNDASKLHAVCVDGDGKAKGKKVEIDHVIRNEDGSVKAIVEAKSGNSGIKGKQALERIAIAKSLGCEAVYKVESGEGGDKAREFLTGKGWSASNVVSV